MSPTLPAPAAAAAASALTDALAAAAKAALPKLAMKWEAFCALSAALRLAGASPIAAAALAPQKLVESAAAAGAILMKPSAAAAMPGDDAAVAAAAAGAVLTARAPLAAPKAAQQAASALLTLLLLHPSSAVRARARDEARAVAAAGGAASAEQLRSALLEWLRRQEDQGALFADGTSEAADSSGQPGASAASADAAAAAVLALCPPGAATPASALPGVLLLAHRRAARQAATLTHPGKAPRAGALWRLIAARIRAADPATFSEALSTPEGAEAAAAALLGASGLASERPEDRDAALAAAASLAEWSPDAALGAVLRGLAEMADAAPHAALSAQDVKVYFTPEGELADDPQRGAFKPQVVYSSAGRKARGRFKMYDDDDDDDAEQRAAAAAKAEAEAKARAKAEAEKKGAKKDPRLEQREQQLAAEAAVRARVAALAAKLRVALQGVASLAQGNRPAAASRLTELLAPVLSLVGSPIVGDDAHACVAAVASFAAEPAALASNARTLADALHCARTAAMGDNPNSVAGFECVQRAVEAAASACRTNRGPGEGRPLPPAVFSLLVFPLLEAVLSTPKPTQLHPDALAVLALHCSPAQAVPHAAMATALLRVFESGGAGSVALPRLLRACAGASSSAEHPVFTALLDGTLSATPRVRAAALDALSHTPQLAEGAVARAGALPAAPVSRLFLAAQDPEEANAAAALSLWARAAAGGAGGEAVASAEYVPLLLPFLPRPGGGVVREMAAKAVAAVAMAQPAAAPVALAQLVALYSECPTGDGRAAAAQAVQLLAPALQSRDLPMAMAFALRALADDSPVAREAAVETGKAVVEAHGPQGVGALLPQVEAHLEKNQGAAPHGATRAEEEKRDALRAGTVVLLGAAAKHLDKDHPKARGEAVVTPAVALMPAAPSSFALSPRCCHASNHA